MVIGQFHSKFLGFSCVDDRHLWLWEIFENLFFTTSDFFQSKNYSVIFYWRVSEVFLHAHAGFRTVDRLVGSGSRAVIGNEGSQAVIGNVAQSLLKMAD